MNRMKYLGTTKFNRNARFNSIGAGKYGGASLNEVRIDTTVTDIIKAVNTSELDIAEKREMIRAYLAGRMTEEEVIMTLEMTPIEKEVYAQLFQDNPERESLTPSERLEAVRKQVAVRESMESITDDEINFPTEQELEEQAHHEAMWEFHIRMGGNDWTEDAMEVQAAEYARTQTTDMRAKVCIIANSLSKDGMSRSKAFRKAWELVKVETVITKVAGVTFENRQAALERLTHYDADRIRITLERDAHNEHDSNAVAVIVSVTGKGSLIIGYLDKPLAAKVAPLMDAKKPVKATFQEIRGKYQSYYHLGMVVGISL